MSAAEPELQQLACLEGQKLVVQCRASQAWATQPCLIGIDEAGRGPVLGPMVYAAAYAPIASDLKSKQFNDSKQLSEAKRDTLFASICSDHDIGFVADILSAQLISSSMLSRRKTSLNRTAEESTFRIIQTVLDAGVNVREVYVDTVGDADRYERTLANRFPALKFTVCPKADALFPIVSAASIVAKVIRDRSLTVCQKELGLAGEMGSGYPGDATTVAWLKANLHPVLGLPRIARFSWETCARLLADPSSNCIALSFEADEEGEPDPQQQKLSFGPAAGTKGTRTNTANTAQGAGGSGCSNRVLPDTSGLGRHVYFKARRMQAVTEAF